MIFRSTQYPILVIALTLVLGNFTSYGQSTISELPNGLFEVERSDVYDSLYEKQPYLCSIYNSLMTFYTKNDDCLLSYSGHSLKSSPEDIKTKLQFAIQRSSCSGKYGLIESVDGSREPDSLTWHLLSVDPEQMTAMVKIDKKQWFYRFSKVVFSGPKNTIHYSGSNNYDLSTNNQSELIFEGQGNEIVVESNNTVDRSQNKKVVVIVKGDNNKIKFIQHNGTDRSKNHSDTIVFDNSQLVRQYVNGQETPIIDMSSGYFQTHLQKAVLLKDRAAVSSLSAEDNYILGMHYLKAADDPFEEDAFPYAKAYLINSAANGCLDAQKLLANCYESGDHYFKIDETAALFWNMIALENGSTGSQTNIDRLTNSYELLTFSVIDDFMKACRNVEQQDDNTIKRVIDAHYKSETVDPLELFIYNNDKIISQCELGVLYLQEGANRGFPNAQYFLAMQLYQQSCGTKGSVDEILNLLSDAHAGGVYEAGTLKETVKEHPNYFDFLDKSNKEQSYESMKDIMDGLLNSQDDSDEIEDVIHEEVFETPITNEIYELVPPSERDLLREE